MRPEWLVVGLGNPGKKYETTWHNLGFMTLEILAQRHHFTCNRLKYKSLCGEARPGAGAPAVLFMLPQTFMNRSGEAVREALQFFRLPPERLLVISDDFDLELGQIRIRANGSAGTHNGLKSIVSCLGTDQFPRIRIGFGPKEPGQDIIDYVLMPIPAPKREKAFEGLSKAADAVELIIRDSLEAAQMRFNTRPKKPKPPKAPKAPKTADEPKVADESKVAGAASAAAPTPSPVHDSPAGTAPAPASSADFAAVAPTSAASVADTTGPIFGGPAADSAAPLAHDAAPETEA